MEIDSYNPEHIADLVRILLKREPVNRGILIVVQHTATAQAVIDHLSTEEIARVRIQILEPEEGNA